MVNHAVVHLDIPAGDPATDAQFYGEVFGWQLNHNAEYDYWMFSAEGGPGGGFVKPGKAGDGMGPGYELGQVVVYIATDDIDASLAAVEAHGGKRLGAKIEMPGAGAYAFFSDPAGNTLGLYTLPAPAG